MSDENINMLPGFEDFFEEEENDGIVVHDGKPSSSEKYFDATNLPDAPERQKVAVGNQTYVTYVISPTYEDMVRVVKALTIGQRKSVAKKATASTLSSMSVPRGTEKTLLEIWEESLLPIVVLSGEDSTEEEDSSDEAQAPV